MYTWALDHRVHHKYSETDADPHDVRRGFFFAHVGWLFTTPHPEVVVKRKAVDMSDLEADPIIMWQKRQETYGIHLFTFAFFQYCKKKYGYKEKIKYISKTFLLLFLLLFRKLVCNWCS